MVRTALPRSSSRSFALASILILAVAAPLQAQEGAVSYALPDGPDVRQAKLSGPVSETYAVVCDSLVDDDCRVRPGTYQLQTFDGTWSGTKSTVIVSADPKVSYALPDGPDVRQAKLSGPVNETYAVVCDSLVDDACRVRPGTYQLQTFDGTWSGTRSTVVVSADSTPPADGRPAPPTGVRFAFYSTTAGALSWDRSATPSLRYEVRRDGEVAVEATFGTNLQERKARLLGRSHLYEVTAITPDDRRSDPARYFLRSYLENPDPLNDPAPLPDGDGAERLAAPTNLGFAFYSSFAGALSWDRPATPGLRYEVRRNGQTVIEETAGTNYQERDARFVDTRYVYEVIAIAPDGRRSAPSALTVDDFDQTEGSTPDPVPMAPEPPDRLIASVISSTTAQLYWDSKPGLRYEVSRDGQVLGITSGRTFGDDGLTGGPTYRYEVVALEDGRRSSASSVEVVTTGSGDQSGIRVERTLRDNAIADDVIDLVETVSGYYEAFPLLSDERPLFEQVETSEPYVPRNPADPESREMPGGTNSVLIDLDATGTGSYSEVFTYRDLDTRQLTRRIATRAYDGTSVAWSGTYYRNDSSSARLEEIEFTTDIRSTGERTRVQGGTFDSDDRNRLSVSVTYDLAVETVDGSELCTPSSGVITFRENDRFDGRDTTSTIERREGDRFWLVSERSVDGTLEDEFLVTSLDLETFCNFPEL